MATADTAKMIAELSLKDKMSGGIDKAIRKIGTLESRVSKIGGHIQSGLGNAARNTERAITVGITAAAGALAYSVKQAVDAETAIAGIAKTVDGDISAVVQSLKEMSNTVPVSFGELAGIAELGGAMGIAKDDLVAFTKQVAILGTTTNVSIDDAATALGQMQNIIALSADEFDNFAAALVDLGNKGNSTEAQILEIARRSGGAAKLIGIAKEQTLGWAAAAANLGLNEELAGTAIQRFFLKTQEAVTAGGDDLEELAKTAGKTTKQFKKAFDENATGALTDFLEGLGKMDKDARLKTIQNVFGKNTGLTRLVIGLADSMDQNLIPSLKTGTQAWKDATAAQEEADKRFATSAAQFSVLKNNINNAAATIGANLLPVLVDLSKEATEFLAKPETQAAIKSFGKDLAKGAREAVTWLKSLDWDAIGGALKSGASFAKSLIDAFVAAPPWVQQFLTAGFVANKFTGGAISGIIGELGKGLIRGVLGMTAGVVNINAATVNGAGGVPGAAAGGGKVGGALKALGAITIIGGLVALSADSIQGFADQNKELKDSGLNAEEIAAMRYYTASAADQATMAKRLGRIPSKADFDSAMAKLNSTTASKSTLIAAETRRLGAKHSQAAARQIGATTMAALAAKNAGSATATAARSAGERARSGGIAAASAIRGKKWQINNQITVPVTTNVSVRDVVQKYYKVGKYGKVAEFG